MFKPNEWVISAISPSQGDSEITSVVSKPRFFSELTNITIVHSFTSSHRSCCWTSTLLSHILAELWDEADIDSNRDSPDKVPIIFLKKACAFLKGMEKQQRRKVPRYKESMVHFHDSPPTFLRLSEDSSLNFSMEFSIHLSQDDIHPSNDAYTLGTKQPASIVSDDSQKEDQNMPNSLLPLILGLKIDYKIYETLSNMETLTKKEKSFSVILPLSDCSKDGNVGHYRYKFFIPPLAPILNREIPNEEGNNPLKAHDDKIFFRFTVYTPNIDDLHILHSILRQVVLKHSKYNGISKVSRRFSLFPPGQSGKTPQDILQSRYKKRTSIKILKRLKALLSNPLASQEKDLDTSSSNPSLPAHPDIEISDSSSEEESDDNNHENLDETLEENFPSLLSNILFYPSLIVEAKNPISLYPCCGKSKTTFFQFIPQFSIEDLPKIDLGQVNIFPTDTILLAESRLERFLWLNT